MAINRTELRKYQQRSRKSSKQPNGAAGAARLLEIALVTVEDVVAFGNVGTNTLQGVIQSTAVFNILPASSDKVGSRGAGAAEGESKAYPGGSQSPATVFLALRDKVNQAHKVRSVALTPGQRVIALHLC